MQTKSVLGFFLLNRMKLINLSAYLKMFCEAH